MATARDLITRSLRLIHVLDSGESPTADEANDSLAALNDMLDSWSVPGLYIYTLKEEALTWPASTQSRTIGAAGNFTTTRPTRIEPSTYIRDSANNDYPLAILETRAGYSGITIKSTESTIPEYLYYEPIDPHGILYLWPVPSASMTLYLHTPEQLDQFASLDTTFAYPPGYKDAIQYSLSMRLASEFGVAVPPEVAELARRSTRAIKRLNTPTHVSQLEVSALGGRRYNIYTD